MKTRKWAIGRVALLPLVFLGCGSCTTVRDGWDNARDVVREGGFTHELWKDVAPSDRVWIPADQITEAELQKRGVNYEKFTDTKPNGYLVAKSSLDKFRDYSILALATPVAVAVDVTGASIVVGAVVGVGAILAIGERGVQFNIKTK